jgi:hypothetical protein
VPRELESHVAELLGRRTNTFDEEAALVGAVA